MIRRAMVLAVAAALGLAACSAGTSADPAKAEATDRLEVMSWWTSGSEHAALQSLYRAFSADHPDVKVIDGAVVGGAGSNVQVVLASRLQSGDPPDVWQTFMGAALQAYYEGGRIVDVSEVYTKSGAKDAMVPEVLDAVTINGKQYGVPTGSHRSNVLWFNLDLLKRAGVAAPTSSYSVDAFLADLATLKAAGITPLCLGGHDAFTSVELFEDFLLAQVGHGGWADITADRFDWGGDKAATAMQDFGRALDYTDPESVTLTWDAATRQLADGKCAFEAFNDSAYGELVNAGATEGKTFGAVPFPGTAPAYLAVVDTFVLARGAKNLRNGLEFLEVIVSPKAALQFNRVKGSVPVLTDVDVASLPPYQREAAKALRQGPVLPSIAHGEAMTPAFQAGFYNAVASYRENRNHSAFVGILRDALSRKVAPAP